ncbi:MAG TPA: hypothetical protein VF271_04770 [Rhodanobacteraceae bacterium]
MNEVTFGDTVKVSSSAPQIFRPGSIGEVVAITETNDDFKINNRDISCSKKYYLVEFGDGYEIEIPEVWVSLV